MKIERRKSQSGPCIKHIEMTKEGTSITRIMIQLHFISLTTFVRPLKELSFNIENLKKKTLINS